MNGKQNIVKVKSIEIHSYILILVISISLGLVFLSIMKVLNFVKVQDWFAIDLLIIISSAVPLFRFGNEKFLQSNAIYLIACFLGGLILWAGLLQFEVYLPIRIILILIPLVHGIAIPLIFSPLFLAIQGMELSLYKIMINEKKLNATYIYATICIGWAISYLIFRPLLYTIGLTKLMILEVIFTFVSISALCNYLKLSSILSKNILYIIPAVLVVLVLIMPSFDKYTLKFFSLKLKTPGPFGTVREEKIIIDEKFVKPGILLSITKSSDICYGGFYDTMSAWSICRVPIIFNGIPFEAKIPESVAIIGIGGGQQIFAVEKFRVKKTLAIDVVDTYDVVKNFNPSITRAVFIVGNGRKVLKERGEKFDLIFLAGTDPGAPTNKALVDPAITLYTKEGLQEIVSALNEDGLIAIYRWAWMHFEEVEDKLMGKIKKVLEEMDFYCEIFKYESRRSGEILYTLFASKDVEVVRRAEIIIEGFGFRKFSPPLSEPLRDIKPFLPGIGTIFFEVISIGFIFCISAGYFIGKKLVKRTKIFLTSFGVGVNFILILNSLIFSSFTKLGNPLDAPYFASISAFVTSSFGAIWWWKSNNNILKSLFAFPFFLIMGLFLSLDISLLLFTFFISGRFLPKLLTQNKAEISQIYAGDVLGSGIGGILSIIVAIQWGLLGLYILIFIIFFILLFIIMKD